MSFLASRFDIEAALGAVTMTSGMEDSKVPLCVEPDLMEGLEVLLEVEKDFIRVRNLLKTILGGEIGIGCGDVAGDVLK